MFLAPSRLWLAGMLAVAVLAAVPVLAEPVYVTRAQLAADIVTLLNQNRSDVSEFPFYRDVPKSDPDYLAIEVARERSMVTDRELVIKNGFFKPGAPITYAELYRVLDRVLSGDDPSLPSSEAILAPFDDHDAVSNDLKPVVAKLVVSDILSPDAQATLSPSAFVTEERMAVLLSKMRARLSVVNFVPKPQPEEEPVLPAGLSLVLEPTSVILQSTLNLGDTLYFSLSQDAGVFPKGSRLTGKVVEKRSDTQYDVLIDELKTPQEQYYRTRTHLLMQFSKKGAFMAPGDLLKLTSD